jgi:hypothetical protein
MVRRRPCTPWRIAIVSAAAVASASCGDDVGPGVRLILEASVAVPATVDEVVVEATASSTAGGRTCMPARRTFPLVSAADLPIRVLWEFGPSYRSWVAFRITWRQGGRDLFAHTVLQAAPGDGVHEVRVALEEVCLTRTCGAGTQCVAGACTNLPSPDPFDPALVVPGTDCAAP